MSDMQVLTPYNIYIDIHICVYIYHVHICITHILYCIVDKPHITILFYITLIWILNHM